MQRLIFDYSPVYFLVCVAVGVAYAIILYSARNSWSTLVNRVLAVLRAALVSLILLLLLGPVLRQTANVFEKPSVVILVDHSRSLKAATDTTGLLSGLRRVALDLENQDRHVAWSNLSGPADSIFFTHRSSDLSAALKQTITSFEGRNLQGIILASDGIYNNGISPLYVPLRVPIYAVGVGDTTERSDIVLKNVAYNRVVYQGNKFPLRAEVGVTGLPDQDITVAVRQQGKVLQQIRKNAGSKSLVDFDFLLDAGVQGIQRLDIVVERASNEASYDNNRANAFVEVVEGKKKVLILASGPHPDIKAFRSVIEKNPNYELKVHVAGVKELPAADRSPAAVDLLIAHQSPDPDGRTTALLGNYIKAKTPTLIVIGNRTQLRALAAAGIPATFEPTGQRDEVQPVLNSDFQDLGFSPEMTTLIGRYPPVTVPFGKFSYPSNARIILNQQIGSLVTDRPLLYTVEQENQKIGVLVGEGIWKWRLGEYQETEKTVAFDELMSKLLQYLSTQDDKRRFRAFPVRHEFTNDAPVVIESQVYNELYEPVYGSTIDIELRDDLGKATSYSYVTGPGGSSRYRIGGLAEGIYRYTASTEIKGKRETAKGEFLVLEQNQEGRSLVADFGLLRKLAKGTEGKFYTGSELNQLTQDLTSREAQAIIHSEESFHPLINLKIVFFLLLLLVSAEWFLRKFAGSY
ncbi:MAG: hypothetical protein SH819_11805 [Cytophagales bacterium]|nr:hypothetical protein [Cytophagales bacterium]